MHVHAKTKVPRRVRTRLQAARIIAATLILPAIGALALLRAGPTSAASPAMASVADEFRPIIPSTTWVNIRPEPYATADWATRPTPASQASTAFNTNAQVPHQPDAASVPVFASFDFMRGYFTNITAPAIVDGKPWDNGSMNYSQYLQPGGGTSYWDYWIENEPWNSPNHKWRDEQGQWHTYHTETIQDASGKTQTAYILVDRPGPGVMDKLWFTHNPVRSFMRVILQKDLFWSADPPDVTEWGSLSRLGNLRIEVDSHVLYDGPIIPWFSGQAQRLTPELQQILVWRYGQFGSDGNIIPIPYQRHLKVYVYGGPDKPKWFMATGVTLPADTTVQAPVSLDNGFDISRLADLAQTVLHPEEYLQSVASPQEYSVTVQSDAPVNLVFKGTGTLAGIQFLLPKRFDLSGLWMRVYYGDHAGIDLPLLAFFGQPDQVIVHHSTPIGIIDSGDNYLLYSNMPMPYQAGMRIELTTASQQSIPVQIKAVALNQVSGTQLRVLYRPSEQLVTYGPDFKASIEGDGKLVGLVLVTGDQGFDSIPKKINSATGKEDSSKLAWPMGYLEGNLAIADGAGNSRYYGGQEDWADGGYYFNSGYTTPPGGSNRPFAGILRYQEGKDGYATLFRYFNDLSAFRFKDGLNLSLGHGTWQNNFPVRYGAVVFYYWQVPGADQTVLPASNYRAVRQPPTNANEPPG